MMSSYISDYSHMFAEFLSELQHWSETGAEPKAGDQDLRYYLDQEEKRLKKRGISVKLNIKPFGDIIQVSKYTEALGIDLFNNARYSQSLHYQSVEKTVIYERNDQEIFRKKDDYVVHLTIIEPSLHEHASIADMDYVCPTCGAISKVHVLEEKGCPYCGGHFIMSDLFPKVSNFWFHKSVVVPEKMYPGLKKWIAWTSLVIAAAVFIYALITQKGVALPHLILRGAAGGLFGGPIFGYLLYFGHKIARLSSIASQDIKITKETKKGREKIDRLLSRFDPAFTYEYFQGKVLSLVRTIIFADDPTNIRQYVGRTLDPEFERYLNIDYGGGMGLEYAEVSYGRIVVGLSIFLQSTVDTDQGVEERLEKFLVRMEHVASFKIDPSFSIQRVNCKSCGASFNALKEKRCPYCDSLYLPEEDWIVTKITRLT